MIMRHPLRPSPSRFCSLSPDARAGGRAYTPSPRDARKPGGARKGTLPPSCSLPRKGEAGFGGKAFTGKRRDFLPYSNPKSFRTISSLVRLGGSIGASGRRTSGLIRPIMPRAVFTGVGLVSMNRVLCSGQSL